MLHEKHKSTLEFHFSYFHHVRIMPLLSPNSPRILNRWREGGGRNREGNDRERWGADRRSDKRRDERERAKKEG